jgi:hypothetical protein
VIQGAGTMPKVLTSMPLIFALACSIAAPTGAQEVVQSKSGCVLEDGQQTAIDGSCGKWKARSLATKPPSKEATEQTRSIKSTPVIDLRDLPPIGLATVRFCVTASHDSHKADYLVVVAGDPVKDKMQCSPPYDNRDECVQYFSKEYRSICANRVKTKDGGTEFKTKEGIVKHSNGNHYWCLERRKREEGKPLCKYLPVRYGHTLSVWITQLHPDKTAPDRQAEGTWAFVQALQ